MPEQTANNAANGRALARARRAALARTGAAGTGRPGSAAGQPAVDPGAALAGLSGRELARARRAMLAQGGNSAAAGSPRGASERNRAAPTTAPTSRPEPAATQLLQNAGEPEPREYCCDECAAREATEPCGCTESPAAAQDLEGLCETLERDPLAMNAVESSVRRYCRERRQALAREGKAALPPKPGRSGAFGGALGQGPGGASNGQQLARQRRAELVRNGRGNAEPARPSGRVRPKSTTAPPKVEIGTTLAGRRVTGTQVERTGRVSGNEVGTCRAITGTEYIGAEQFADFCETMPQPAVPKLQPSSTGHGQTVTGPAVGRSLRVTGDEAGSCRPVTGTEYLGQERFAEFCAGQGAVAKPDKVTVGRTMRMGLPVSGSDEARGSSRVTGGESGAGRAITGSQYADARARATINGAPEKVALTHTLAGRPVSGTAVGRSAKVTGDEAGSCGNISGTEYLSNEQFQSVCHARPAPAPAKVGQDASRGGQRITGNLVDRSAKVTGNEPGSCQRVSGSQYGESSLCGGAPGKVHAMHTIGGRALTGTEVDHGPKLTGDEHGGCQPVTGTEYYGREQYAAYCSGIPAPAADKVGVSRTWHGQTVTGTQASHSAQTTGDEAGTCAAVSGTPYVGGEQYAAFCTEARSEAAAARSRVLRATPGMPATGIQPGPDPKVTGVTGVGVCRPVTGTPYLGADSFAAACEASSPGTAHHRAQAPLGGVLPQSRPAVSAPPVNSGFSVLSPANEARQRITGAAYGAGARITGPVSLATGLVSGTPEFRYRDDTAAVVAVPAALAATAEPAESERLRITGEGREAGPCITGDDWARSGRVTGTEGLWAQGRNPTLRGEPRGAGTGAGAWAKRERETVPPPAPLRVTGSSGGAEKGPVVTYSGGARG